MTGREAGTDADLVDRLRHGDDAAFTELVERYHRSLVRFAASFVHGPEVAEDVVQETWLAVLRGIDRFEGRSALRTWLFGVCANRARTMATREQRTVPVDPADLARAMPGDDGEFRRDGSWASPPQPWPDTHADDEALVARVRLAIDDLPAAQRQVVTLRDVTGLSADEVCAVLAIKDANQRVLLHRGRARVRRALAQALAAR